MREWFRKRRVARRARKLLDEAFRTPALLEGTSLKPRHGSRYVLLGHDEEDGRIRRIRFGIVRHPRPYPFSGQHHRVAEFYVYDVSERSIRVVKGINLTRAEGLDAE